MNHFIKIKEALEFIDAHLDEPLSLEKLAERYHFSAYYFHRMFSVIVGKTLAIHIRDRRLLFACRQLIATKESILTIGLACGYNSAQAFSRAFKKSYGLSPSEYREKGYAPVITTIDEMIMKFTNRLRGGIDLNPRILKQEALILAGTSGDGNKTGEVWNNFETLCSKIPLTNQLSGNGYEVRVYDGDACTVYVGLAVADENVDAAYTLFKLPAATYAAFDVYVANGYDSENSAMDEWLKTNRDGYSERLLDTRHYCVEYYDERFKGSETGSIVAIWIPVTKLPH